MAPNGKPTIAQTIDLLPASRPVASRTHLLLTQADATSRCAASAHSAADVRACRRCFQIRVVAPNGDVGGGPDCEMLVHLSIQAIVQGGSGLVGYQRQSRLKRWILCVPSHARSDRSLKQNLRPFNTLRWGPNGELQDWTVCIS